MITYQYDDGGRAAAGYKGSAGDCVTRAIAIATELPYAEVYAELFDRAKALAPKKQTQMDRRIRRFSKQRGMTEAEYRALAKGRRNLVFDPSPRNGMSPDIYKPWLAELGWQWQPTMTIGSGTTVHLRPEELPAGRIIVRLSRHLAAVIDGVVHDTGDPSRGGTRAVYGYWHR